MPDFSVYQYAIHVHEKMSNIGVNAVIKLYLGMLRKFEVFFHEEGRALPENTYSPRPPSAPTSVYTIWRVHVHDVNNVYERWVDLLRNERPLKINFIPSSWRVNLYTANWETVGEVELR